MDVGRQRQQCALFPKHKCSRSRRSVRKGSTGAAAHRRSRQRHVTAFSSGVRRTVVALSNRAVVMESRLASHLHRRKADESHAPCPLPLQPYPLSLSAVARRGRMPHTMGAWAPSYLHCRRWLQLAPSDQDVLGLIDEDDHRRQGQQQNTSGDPPQP